MPGSAGLRAFPNNNVHPWAALSGNRFPFLAHLVERVTVVLIEQEDEALPHALFWCRLVPVASTFLREWALDLALGVRFRLRQDAGQNFGSSGGFGLRFYRRSRGRHWLRLFSFGHEGSIGRRECRFGEHAVNRLLFCGRGFAHASFGF